MHRALRGSSVVRIVRHSRVAALSARLRRAVSRGSDDTNDGDGPKASAASSDETAEDSDAPPAAQSSVVSGSSLFGLFAWFGALIEGSWLYRWLTAEPDPDVIVIDLRETWIVGPILAVLDWIIAHLSTTGDSSLLAGIARRGYRLTVNRPIQLLSFLLGGVVLALVAVIVAGGTASIPLVALVVILALCAAVGSRITWSWANVRETRLVRLIVAAFEPPEPPNRQDDSEDQSDDER